MPILLPTQFMRRCNSAKQKPAPRADCRLGSQIMPAKREKPRRASPSIRHRRSMPRDAGREDSGLLMEPGSGVPDVKNDHGKVRAGQRPLQRVASRCRRPGRCDRRARRGRPGRGSGVWRPEFVSPPPRQGQGSKVRQAGEGIEVDLRGVRREPPADLLPLPPCSSSSCPIRWSPLDQQPHQAEQPVDQRRAIDTMPADQKSSADPVKATEPASEANLDTTPALREKSRIPRRSKNRRAKADGPG